MKMHADQPTKADLIRKFTDQKGIMVSSLREGTKILIETTTEVYRLAVLGPDHVPERLIEVHSTDRRFPRNQVIKGLFIGSVYDAEGQLEFPDKIAQNLRMVIGFKNGKHQSTPVRSARLEGEGWHFDAII